MSHKIGVIGDENSVLVYRMLGFEVFMSDNPEDASNILDNLANENYGVIYVTEKVAEKITETIKKYDDKMLPAIILIPDHTGSRGIGKRRVQENVEKAVGQNIL
ncbi:MAG TPA: V-type ATP synthase subunit F [Atopostipes sp.]|jgi:V/A-type H+-transporting ATPase subunit F|nr:V-type ATP synthase subunit F [Atopostipes sp.]